MSTEAEEYKNQGNTALKAKHYAEAIKLYTKAIDIDGANHVYYSNRSAAYLASGNASLALEDAESCINLSPQNFIKGYSRKGAALHVLKRYNDAIAAYESGLEKYPNDAGLEKGLSEAKRDQTRSANPSAAAGAGPGAGLNNLFGPNLMGKIALHPKLRGYLGDPTYVEKVQKLSRGEMAEDLLSDPRVMETLQCMLGIPDTASADNAEESKAAPAPTPTPAPATQHDSAQPMETDNTPTATRAESEPMEIEDDNKQKALDAKKRGNDFYKKRQFDDALAAYDEAIELDPTSMTYHSNKAAVYLTIKEYDQAIKACEMALEVGKENFAPFEDRAKALARIGRAYELQKRFAEAIEAYKNAQLESFDKGVQRTLKNLELEKRKLDVLAYQDDGKAEEAKERGNDFFRKKQFGDAVREYEEACKRSPKNPLIRNNLAAALCKIMDFNGAKREIELALDLDPSYVKAYARKGDIECAMKEYHKAMDSYKQGLALDSTNATCKEGLRKVSQAINSNMTEEERKERAAHAMADPEIQNILQDPVIRQILQDFNENPNAANQAMRDPGVRSKIEKLIASGILQTG